MTDINTRDAVPGDPKSHPQPNSLAVKFKNVSASASGWGIAGLVFISTVAMVVLGLMVLFGFLDPASV